MKNKLTIIASSLALASASHAAISLSGPAVSGFGALAPVGTLVLLVVDDTGTNFGGASNPLSGDLTSTSVDPLALPGTSISTGDRFGGDIILGRLAVTSAGTLPGGFTFDNVAALQGDRFSLIFLPSLTLSSTNANLVAGVTKYGIVSGSDWILPSVNGGESFLYNSSDNGGDGTFFRTTIAAGVSTNGTYASSSGANLNIGVAVPEPSAALLGAIGALGLLRRRRI
jgi:hypothetical protein